MLTLMLMPVLIQALVLKQGCVNRWRREQHLRTRTTQVTGPKTGATDNAIQGESQVLNDRARHAGKVNSGLRALDSGL